MEKLETLEQEIKSLSPGELSQFRAWFAQFDAAAWDQQIERDSKDGKLNSLAQRALADHRNRKTTAL